jgi:hypothetical protein
MMLIFSQPILEEGGEIIRVQRDMTADPTRQDIQDFGCVVVRGLNDPKRDPWVAVSGGATDDQCARFEFTWEEVDWNSDQPLEARGFRMKELYVVIFLYLLFHFDTSFFSQ